MSDDKYIAFDVHQAHDLLQGQLAELVVCEEPGVLLIPQGNEGVNARGAACGKIARQGCYGCQRQG